MVLAFYLVFSLDLGYDLLIYKSVFQSSIAVVGGNDYTIDILNQ